MESVAFTPPGETLQHAVIPAQIIIIILAKERTQRQGGGPFVTCRMSLWRCSVCISAAFSDGTPALLVYSAILSFIPVSCRRKKHPRKCQMAYSCKKTTVHELKEAARHAHLVQQPRWDFLVSAAEIQIGILPKCCNKPKVTPVTFPRSCSISTAMVSNILSWLDPFNKGVVSELRRRGGAVTEKLHHFMSARNNTSDRGWKAPLYPALLEIKETLKKVHFLILHAFNSYLNR